MWWYLPLHWGTTNRTRTSKLGPWCPRLWRPYAYVYSAPGKVKVYQYLCQSLLLQHRGQMISQSFWCTRWSSIRCGIRQVWRARTFGICSIRSGYFLLMSSEFLLKTLTLPSGSRCTWNIVKQSSRLRAIYTYLCTFSIILVLARKPLVLEPIKNLSDRFGRFRKHRLQRNSRSELAVVMELLNPEFQ